MPNTVDTAHEYVIHARARPEWIKMAVALLPVLACFLGGGTEKWAEGVVVAALGLLLIFDPPRHSLGKLINGILLALLVCAALSFLPASWFFKSSWRPILIVDFGIALPATLSPQPWVTLGCLVSFLAGLSWFYYVCVQEIEMRDVRFQIRLFAGGIVLLAAISLLLYLKHLALPLWHNERNFGPFPNRNQTGDIFGITAIVLLASAQDHFRRGKMYWILSAFGFAILIAGLIVNYSRAGILILIGGSAIWLAIAALRQATPARIALGLSAVLILLTALLIFGGATLERFHLHGAGHEGVSSDFRLLIFRDAWHLIWSSPWCGIGLGNFEPIFAISRFVSSADTRSLHPESDWLWLWTELGWPGILFVVLAIGSLLPHVFPLTSGTNQRIRLGALIGALLFALHGFIDVSAHRVGTAYAGIFLFGAALHRPFQFQLNRSLPIISRLIGVCLFAAGIIWVGAARYHWALPGSLGADNLRASATSMNRSTNFDESIAMTSRALEWKVLDWRLYFLRALGKVGAKRNVSTAIDDFRRARFLEPNAYEVAFDEGVFWLTNRRPTLAITAWRDALRRAGPLRPEVYSQMFSDNVWLTPALIRELATLAGNDPPLVLAALRRTPANRFNVTLEKFFEADPDLHAFHPQERDELLKIWAERGDAEAFMRDIQLHPEWRAAAWQGIAGYYAGKKDFRAAVELIRQFAPPPVLPAPNESSSLEALQQKFYANPNDFSVGYALYRAQMQLGKTDDALSTLRHFTALAGAPSYFYFLEIEPWAAKENWEQAWNAWLAFERTNKK